MLKNQILDCLAVNPSYGHRRIALALSTHQYLVGKKRVRRVMKLYNIKPYKRKARWSKGLDFKKPSAVYPNLIKDTCPINPNIVFAGDFTHLRWNSKFIYLATFMDLYTREIVGWSVSTKHTSDLVISAYLDAVKTRGKSQVVHTDQGSEYQSKEYVSFMAALGIQISMSKKASPWENGHQESWYDNFKTDLGAEFERFETLPEFVVAIHQTINYYNKERIHTTLKMPPAVFNQKYLETH